MSLQKDSLHLIGIEGKVWFGFHTVIKITCQSYGQPSITTDEAIAGQRTKQTFHSSLLWLAERSSQMTRRLLDSSQVLHVSRNSASPRLAAFCKIIT